MKEFMRVVVALVILSGIGFMIYDLSFEAYNAHKVTQRLEGYFGYNDVKVFDRQLKTPICGFHVNGNIGFTATYKGERIHGAYCWDVERTQGGPRLYN